MYVYFVLVSFTGLHHITGHIATKKHMNSTADSSSHLNVFFERLFLSYCHWRPTNKQEYSQNLCYVISYPPGEIKMEGKKETCAIKQGLIIKIITYRKIFLLWQQFGLHVLNQNYIFLNYRVLASSKFSYITIFMNFEIDYNCQIYVLNR